MHGSALLPAWDAASAEPAVQAPLLLTAAEAAALCRTSVRTWRAWDAAGKVPRAIRIGRAKLWRPDELREWVAAGCPERSIWNHR
jgi:predicted DNA-binding transcriptional regulator AlpA